MDWKEALTKASVNTHSLKRPKSVTGVWWIFISFPFTSPDFIRGHAQSLASGI